MLINPPVYDFALYDLFVKPYGMFRVGRWLQESGYDTIYVNALATMDPATEADLGRLKRKNNGTGKFFRQPAPLPQEIKRYKRDEFQRRFARYGILRASLEQRIAARKPDIVFISSGMTYWYRGVVEAVEIARKHHPAVPVVVGGIYATLMPDHCSNKTGADTIFTGCKPAELTAVLKKFSLGLPTEGRRTENRAFPYPFPEKQYWGEGGVIRLNEGCPFQCDYCASHLLCSRFIPGDPGKLYDHFEQMYGSGLRNFAFYDDALLTNSETVLFPFLQQVINGPSSPAFYLPNAVHVHLLTGDTASLLKRAGFQEVRLGFESASEDFHDAYDRKFAMDAFGNAVENMKAAGFSGKSIGVYILAGLPGQCREEVEESIRYAESFDVKIYIAEYSPVPGTSLWKKCVSKTDLPLEEEPLFHNNTFFPMEWEGFKEDDLKELKIRVKSYNRDLITEP